MFCLRMLIYAKVGKENMDLLPRRKWWQYLSVPLSAGGGERFSTLQNQRKCLAILALSLLLKSHVFHVPFDTFALFLEMGKVS